MYAIQSVLCALIDAKKIKDWFENIQADKGDILIMIMNIVSSIISIALVVLLFTHFGLPVWMLVLAMTMNTFWITTKV